MKQEDVILKLRALKVAYISNSIGKNPALMNDHLGEFLGYATFLYDFYADALRKYERAEARVTQEEQEAMEKVNATATKREERMTQAELDKRIDIRMSELKANKKRLEQLVKGATLHINGCQSLLKTWGDEAKGVR